MTYPDHFEHYGFLSKESETHLASSLPEFATDFDGARELVRIAYAELIEPHESQDEIAALLLWLRAIEAAQGALILCDRGLTGASMACARTAWECIFYASAIWKSPALVERLMQYHDYERLHQAKQIRATVKGLSESSAKEIESLLADGPADRKKWSVWDAATAAGLEEYFEVHYRGLSIGGAHASVLSLDRHFHNAETELEITWQPEFSSVKLIVMSVGECLRNGISRMRDHGAKSLGPMPSPE